MRNELPGSKKTCTQFPGEKLCDLSVKPKKVNLVGKNEIFCKWFGENWGHLEKTVKSLNHSYTQINPRDIQDVNRKESHKNTRTWKIFLEIILELKA